MTEYPPGGEPTTAAPPPTPLGPSALLTPMRRVVRVGTVASLAALALAALLGWVLDGAAGAWGGLIGMGLAVAFFAMTVAVALATARMAPTQLGAWVLGSWLLKMVLLIVVLAVLRSQDFYSRPMLFGSLLVGTFGLLLLEARIIATTNVPYVEPGPR